MVGGRGVGKRNGGLRGQQKLPVNSRHFSGTWEVGSAWVLSLYICTFSRVPGKRKKEPKEEGGDGGRWLELGSRWGWLWDCPDMSCHVFCICTLSFVFVFCIFYFVFVSTKVGMAGLLRREREGEGVWWPPGNLR